MQNTKYFRSSVHFYFSINYHGISSGRVTTESKCACANRVTVNSCLAKYHHNTLFFDNISWLSFYTKHVFLHITMALLWNLNYLIGPIVDQSSFSKNCLAWIDHWWLVDLKYFYSSTTSGTKNNARCKTILQNWKRILEVTIKDANIGAKSVHHGNTSDYLVIESP